MSSRTVRANGLEITVPLSCVYVDVAKHPDGFLWARLKIQMPDQCAWCGSELVSGARWVRLHIPNPGHLSKSCRIAASAATLLVGGGLAGTSIIHGDTVTSAELVKFKSVILDMLAPHCPEHANTPPQEAFAVQYPALADVLIFPIRVRDEAYAQAIAAANASVPVNPTPTEIEPVVRASKRTLSALTLDGFVWPDRCVACGSSDISARYPIKIKQAASKQIIRVPICRDEVPRAVRTHTLGGVLASMTMILLFGFAALTFAIKLSTGVQIGVCATAALAIVGFMAHVDNLLAKRLGTSKVMNWTPVTVERKNGHYMLTFNTEEMADAVFVLNQRAYLYDEADIAEVRV